MPMQTRSTSSPLLLLAPFPTTLSSPLFSHSAAAVSLPFRISTDAKLLVIILLVLFGFRSRLRVGRYRRGEGAWGH